MYQYITVLSEIKLPHNSSPHDLCLDFHTAFNERRPYDETK